jgi:spore maturation protein CgeB
VKILVLNESDPYCLGASYLRAFRELGHEANLHDPAKELAHWPAWRSRLVRRALERPILALYSRRLLRRLVAEQADLIWVGKGAWALPWLWREFKRQCPSSALVCYNADNPIVTYSRGGNRPWVTASVPLFDWYITYNTQLLEPLRRAGAKRVLRLPFAWDPVVHPVLPVSEVERQQYACDVVFVGNGDATRERWLDGILREAGSCGWRMAVYGSWGKCRSARVRESVRGAAIYGADMVKAIRSAKLAVNILREQNAGSHNMRTFEIPGCGGIMVSQHSPEQQEFFPGGKAAVYFKDTREAAAKITALLASESQRGQLRARASEIVRDHVYVERARKLLETVAEMNSTRTCSVTSRSRE